MYGLFKENGPYLIGWDESAARPALLNNIYSWNLRHNLLYIDNPVGTGFSFTDDSKGYPRSDQQLATELLEALSQFMLLYPHMISGAVSAKTPIYAFGESYGGAYVVSLAHVYLQQRFNSCHDSSKASKVANEDFFVSEKRIVVMYAIYGSKA